VRGISLSLLLKMAKVELPALRWIRARSFRASATGNKGVVALGKEDVPTMEVISR
jgi:hypothetical protein